MVRRIWRNPLAMVWSGALMLDFLGMAKESSARPTSNVRAIEDTLKQGPTTLTWGALHRRRPGNALAALIRELV